MTIDKKEVRAKAAELATKAVGDYYKNTNNDDEPFNLELYIKWVTDAASDIEKYIQTGDRA